MENINIDNLIEKLETKHFNAKTLKQKKKIELKSEALFYLKKNGISNTKSLLNQNMEQLEQEIKQLNNKLRLLNKDLEIFKIIKSLDL